MTCYCHQEPRIQVSSSNRRMTFDSHKRITKKMLHSMHLTQSHKGSEMNRIIKLKASSESVSLVLKLHKGV